MNCEECQNSICDHKSQEELLEETLQHLHGCNSCREFQQTWNAVDAELTNHASKVGLPPDFDEQLFKILPDRAVPLSAGEIAILRKEYEEEYKQALEQLRSRFFAPEPGFILSVMALIGGIAFLGMLLKGFALTWLAANSAGFQGAVEGISRAAVVTGFALAGVLFLLKDILRSLRGTTLRMVRNLGSI